ncbi:hypothetical protein M0804_000125 [Polistes exclamans]|nr:hypothetical protein M0804_000125 [Polistes exclamans]
MNENDSNNLYRWLKRVATAATATVATVATATTATATTTVNATPVPVALLVQFRWCGSQLLEEDNQTTKPNQTKPD